MERNLESRLQMKPIDISIKARVTEGRKTSGFFDPSFFHSFSACPPKAELFGIPEE